MFLRRLRGDPEPTTPHNTKDEDEVIEECWENQRFIPFQRPDGASSSTAGGGTSSGSVSIHNAHSWGPSGESAFGRAHWSTKKGDLVVCRESFMLPAGWSWVTSWDVAPHKDSFEGWYYAPDFSVSTRFCTTKPNKLSLVRRRKWVRVRKNCTAELERVSSVRGKGNSSLADRSAGGSASPIRISSTDRNPSMESRTESSLSTSNTPQVFVPQFCFRYTTWTCTAFYGFPVVVSINAYGGLLHTLRPSGSKKGKPIPTLLELIDRLQAREQDRVHNSFYHLHPLLSSASFFDSSRTAAAIAASNATAYEDATVEEGVLNDNGSIIFKKTTKGSGHGHAKKDGDDGSVGGSGKSEYGGVDCATNSGGVGGGGCHWEAPVPTSDEEDTIAKTSLSPTHTDDANATASDSEPSVFGREASAFSNPDQQHDGSQSPQSYPDYDTSTPPSLPLPTTVTNDNASSKSTLPAGLQPLNENHYAKVLKRKKLATRVGIRTLGYVHKYGIAPMLRRHLWVAWSGASARKSADPALFKELAEAGVRLMEVGHRNGPNEMLGEIMVDVVRTAPRHPFFEHSQVVGLLRPRQQRGSADGSPGSLPNGNDASSLSVSSSPANRTISSAIATNSIGVRSGGFINDDSGSYRLTLTLVCLALYEREQSAQYTASNGRSPGTNPLAPPRKATSPTTSSTPTSYAKLIPKSDENAPVADNRFMATAHAPLVRSRTNSDASVQPPAPISSNLVNGGNRVPEYHQAFSYLAAVLLLNMPEEEAFWTMVCILENYLPQGYYDDFEMHTDLRVLVELVQDELPDLDAVFQQRQVDISVFASGWLQGLFCAHFPFPTAARILDVMFAEGNSSILVRFIFSFLQVYKKELIEMDGSCTVGQFANAWAREAFDVEGVLAGAMSSTSRLHLMTVVEDRRFELRRQRVKGDLAVGSN